MSRSSSPQEEARLTGARSGPGGGLIPPILAPGASVNITIGLPARRYVVMNNPYFGNPRFASGDGGTAVSATYHACRDRRDAFPQSFSFTDGRILGCVPLDVRVFPQRRVRHGTLALFERCGRQR